MLFIFQFSCWKHLHANAHSLIMRFNLCDFVKFIFLTFKVGGLGNTNILICEVFMALKISLKWFCMLLRLNEQQ